MQTLLIVISVISTISAAVMCAIVIRMLREERRRSDARVEALVALADTPDRGDGEPVPVFEVRSSAAPAVFMRPERAVSEEPPGDTQNHLLFGTELTGSGTGDRSWDRTPDPEISDPGTQDAGPRTEGFRTRDQGPGTDVPPLFLSPASPSPWGRRLAAAAALALIAVVGAFAFGSADRGGVVPDEAESAAQAPIELLSLTHAVENGALTITGLVQNPRGGWAHTDVRAVAYLLDEEGQTVATGMAPLDFRRFEAGVESPFVVTVAMAERVTRYRVGFRDAAGGIIAHVDRRQAAPIARRD